LWRFFYGLFLAEVFFRETNAVLDATVTSVADNKGTMRRLSFQALKKAFKDTGQGLLLRRASSK